jgi:Do/DeqQ family serine protease
MDPFFRQFFGLDMAPSQPRISHGMGSGFIVSSDGYILTCEHVVGSADTIEVTLTGHDTPYSAKKIGTDKELDLAVLKIDPAGVELPALNLGDFDQVRVGDWVIAIGNPYGLDHTVTVGVISAKGRPVTIQSRQYKDLLQTDASINPGNSGGPLLNLNGEVVGINNAINAQAQGIGFAIPSSTVEEALRDMIEKGGIDRPWLGVTSQAVNRQTANYYGLQDTSGALVVQVTPASPAEKAGLKRGDLITHYNGSKINKPEELTALVGSSGIGAKAEIRFNRGNESMTLTVTIEANNN